MFLRKKEDREVRNESGAAAGAGMGGLFMGILIGAVAGGIAALIFAPKSGRETRDIIRGKASEAQHMVQSKVGEVREKVGQVKENMRSRAEEEAESIERTSG